MAHMNICILYYKASTAGSVECNSAYLAAATRLLAEFRRTAPAIPIYREAAQRLKQDSVRADVGSEKDTSYSELEERENGLGSSQGCGIRKPAGTSSVVA